MPSTKNSAFEVTAKTDNVISCTDLSRQISPLTWEHMFFLPKPEEINETLKKALLIMNPNTQIPNMEDFFRRYPQLRPSGHVSQPTATSGQPLPSNGPAPQPQWQTAPRNPATPPSRTTTPPLPSTGPALGPEQQTTAESRASPSRASMTTAPPTLPSNVPPYRPYWQPSNTTPRAPEAPMMPPTSAFPREPSSLPAHHAPPRPPLQSSGPPLRPPWHSNVNPLRGPPIRPTTPASSPPRSLGPSPPRPSLPLGRVRHLGQTMGRAESEIANMRPSPTSAFRSPQTGYASSQYPPRSQFPRPSISPVTGFDQPGSGMPQYSHQQGQPSSSQQANISYSAALSQQQARQTSQSTANMRSLPPPVTRVNQQGNGMPASPRRPDQQPGPSQTQTLADAVPAPRLLYRGWGLPPSPEQQPAHPAPRPSRPPIGHFTTTSTQSARQNLPPQSATPTPPPARHPDPLGYNFVRRAIQIEQRAEAHARVAEADAARRVNDGALQHQGREMNPRMLSPAERTRVIDLNGGVVPRNWPVYEQFANTRADQSMVRNEEEANPVWNPEYGMEEVVDCLDREDNEDDVKCESDRE